MNQTRKIVKSLLQNIDDAETETIEAEAEADDVHGTCIVSDHIITDGSAIGYMYRDEALDIDEHGNQDSGWRFFSGAEDQEYINDAVHLICCDIADLIDRDPQIAALLTFPTGSAFGRNKDNEFELERED